MIFEVIKILILKTIAMKNSFFSKTLVIIFLFGGFSVNGQVKIKTDRSNKNKKVVVKTNRSNHDNRGGVRVKSNRFNYHNDRRGVRTNRNRVVVSKPNRPKVIVNRPNYHRSGYHWAEGYWKWNSFYGQYTWQKAKWIKIKINHYWVPGFWEINPGGFFWVEGYWELEF